MTDVVISEIMYDPKESGEWVELHNIGLSPVTIFTGSGANSWRFHDGSPHTFRLHPINQSAVTIPPGGFAVLADDPGDFLTVYPQFAGILFDVVMSLHNDGDILKLSADRGVSYFGEVSYSSATGGSNGKTLELDNGVWRESYVNGGTPGGPPSTPPVYSSDVVINELLPNPGSGDEFIELYNTGTTEIDLAGWQIDDIVGAGSSAYTIPAGTTITAGGYLVFSGKVALNNTGDTANLISPAGGIKSTFTYPSSTKGRAWARKVDGAFALTRIVTPGQANQFPEPVRSPDIVINEIIPDPSTGAKTELIELRNLSLEPVDITDWQLDDADGGAKPYVFPEGTVIPAGGFWIVYQITSGITLNDDGDSVRLFWQDTTQIGNVVYSKARVGESYSRTDDGTFAWSTVLTPGSPNQIMAAVDDVAQSSSAPPPVSPISDIRIRTSDGGPESVEEVLPEVVIPTPVLPTPLPQPSARVLATTANKGRMGTPMVASSSGMIIFLGGIHQWYIRRRLRRTPNGLPLP